jgi:hypothetical protein
MELPGRDDFLQLLTGVVRQVLPPPTGPVPVEMNWLRVAMTFSSRCRVVRQEAFADGAGAGGCRTGYGRDTFSSQDR